MKFISILSETVFLSMNSVTKSETKLAKNEMRRNNQAVQIPKIEIFSLKDFLLQSAITRGNGPPSASGINVERVRRPGRYVVLSLQDSSR